MNRARALPWLTVGLLASACWQASPAPPAVLEVEGVSPSLAPEAEPLLLNDSVTVYFSAPIHALSVTADTVSVVDREGHAVPGSLETGSDWVTFSPEPPLSPGLQDGSFRPGEDYRLRIAGYPRPDAVRAVDGRRLDRVYNFPIRMAGVGPYRTAMGELPAPLRPPVTDLPFLLWGGDDLPQKLPADAPRLYLHFTLPVLPTSAHPEAFVVQLARGLRLIEPRSVRVVTSRLDPYPGSTVEVDLGLEPRVIDGGLPVSLQAGDMLSVALADGERSLRDLSGNPVLSAAQQFWSVAEGSALVLVSWPTQQGGISGDDSLWPDFESLSGLVRPRVRVEAGDGSLGVFRPQRDTVLRAGQPFDRGDGVTVQSRGLRFPFLAIDIPEGVRVRVEGQGVRLQACGGIRIDGVLELDGAGADVVAVQHGVPVSELLDLAPVALLASGDVTVRGSIVTAFALPPSQSGLTIASAGRIHLLGELPYNTMLAVESWSGREQQAIVGARGQTFAAAVTFEYGLAEGAAFAARAVTPWRRMPRDRDGGVLRLLGVDPAITVSWQSVPPDPVDPQQPDRRADRASRPRPAHDGQWIPVDPGSFVRFRLESSLDGGRTLPSMKELRLVDR